MTDPLFDEDDEANTPVTEEERKQLMPTYITLRSELNEAEQINITEASRWYGRKRNADIVDDALLKELHKCMFGQVWKWAGKYHQIPRNIGIDAYRIPTEMRQLVHNVRFWTENNTYPPDEIAVRFSHQLVSIHPFPNGNGRLSRMAGDYLAIQLGRPPFTWRPDKPDQCQRNAQSLYRSSTGRRPGGHRTNVEICPRLAARKSDPISWHNRTGTTKWATAASPIRVKAARKAAWQ